MACKLPLVVTQFGGLPERFEVVPGLVFVEDPEQIPVAACEAFRSNHGVETRRAVDKYSWEAAADLALSFYCRLTQ